MAEYIEKEALRNALYDADAITISGISIINRFPAVDVLPMKWIPVTERLPNEEEIPYDGIGRDRVRSISDRVLAVNEAGFIRTGYFLHSNQKHYDTGDKRWSFGEHYNNNPEEWVVGTSWEAIAWMPLPEPPKGAGNG